MTDLLAFRFREDEGFLLDDDDDDDDDEEEGRLK